MIARTSRRIAFVALAVTGTAAPHTVAAQSQTPASVASRWVVAEGGNEARYRVREQLAGFDFPNDAVGSSAAITGGIVVAADGSILARGSRFEFDLTTLESDEARRDNYLRRNTLGTEEHPRAVFAPTGFRGLPSPLPATGEATFELVGDLTVRGVTRPVTWTVAARFDQGAIVGQARTEFTFEQFELTKPRLARLLSVADEIRLEYDFRLVPAEPEA